MAVQLYIEPEYVDKVLGAINILESQNSQLFPYEPLEKMIGIGSRSGVADVLDVSVELVKRFETKGLTVDEADRFACKINLHPMYIWDSWMDIEPIPDSLLDLVEEYISDKKKCAGCGEWKELDQYFKRAKSNDGRAHKCKQCALHYESERKARLGGSPTED